MAVTALCDEPEVKAAIERLRVCETALAANPDDAAALDAARIEAAAVKAAYHALIEKRLEERHILHTCDAVIGASKTFGDIYGAVNAPIEDAINGEFTTLIDDYNLDTCGSS